MLSITKSFMGWRGVAFVTIFVRRLLRKRTINCSSEKLLALCKYFLTLIILFFNFIVFLFYFLFIKNITSSRKRLIIIKYKFLVLYLTLLIDYCLRFPCRYFCISNLFNICVFRVLSL